MSTESPEMRGKRCESNRMRRPKCRDRGRRGWKSTNYGVCGAICPGRYWHFIQILNKKVAIAQNT